MNLKGIFSLKNMLRDAVFWAALAMVVIIWTAIGIVLGFERERAINAAAQSASILADAVREHANLLLKQADRVLKNGRKQLRADATSDELNAFLASDDIASRHIDLIAIIDMAGFVTAASAKTQQTKIYVGDREHIAFQFKTKDDFVFVGKPVIARLNSRWSIPVTRKIFGSDGNMTGVLIIALSPTRLADYYKSLLPSPKAQIAMIGLDSVYRVRASRIDSPVGGTIQDRQLIEAASANEAGRFIGPAMGDKEAQILAYHRLAGFPAFVMASIPESDALADFTVFQRDFVCFGILMTFGILFIAYALAHHRTKLVRLVGTLEHSQSLAAVKTRELSMVLDRMTSGIIMVDGQGMVRLVNRQFVDILCVSPRFLHQQLPFSELVADLMSRGDFQNDLVEGEISLRQAIDFEASCKMPICYSRRRKNGRIIEVSSEPLPEGGFVRTITDITERHRHEQAQKASLLNLERFTRVATRDLQEPLHEIGSELARLKGAVERRDPTLSSRSLRHLAEAAQRGRDIANELVRYAQHCVSSIEPRAVMLNDIVDECFQRACDRYEDRWIDLKSTLPAIKVSCDPHIIAGVFDSLIATAMNFRFEQQTLEMKIYGYFCPHTDRFLVHVRDNGCGFVMTGPERIFEPFARLDGAVKRIDIGMGLAIAQAGIEKHGWEISAHSVIDVGSTFTLTLARRDVLEVDGSAAGAQTAKTGSGDFSAAA